MANKKQAADFEPLHQLVRHHIESFDYMVDEGLNEMLDRIKPIIVHDSFTNKKLKNIISFHFFIGNLIDAKRVEVVSRNISRVPFDKCFVLDKYFLDRKGASSSFWTTSLVLFEEPHYQWVILKYFHLKRNTAPNQVRDVLLPFESKRCHLRDADPQKLKSFKEEASEVGGYFILNGLERVFRAVILPKQNFPMSMVRNSFRDRREGYTNKAVVLRFYSYILLRNTFGTE
ncbi:hypothetical protein Patl1_05690 [Pistacia atlantica]|uniref:Uncharacterized protein n=1 Tax=Pistacia atlantica TaxID=434234 RepID=A0ACC1BSW9_9ROSI|nr:hypothetical protein Patl1_05690 [Pistacia atlantica]